MSADSKHRCPSCGSTDTRHSYPGGALDMFMELFGKRPFRCRGCRKRFYGRDDAGREQQSGGSEEPMDHEASLEEG